MMQFVKANAMPIIVGVLSAAFTATVVVTRLEEKMSVMQRDMARHEQTIEKEIQRHESSLGDLTKRTDDQERRITRSESALESISSVLLEIKGDVKLLLREGKP